MAYAQVIPQPISLSASPPSPEPRSSFTVSASTPTFEKETAFFEWTADGKALREFSGLGAHQITLTAGAVGSPTKISVAVSRRDGDGGSASLTVIPSELSLPWIADTSVPLWYTGKALATPGADVSVVAVPQIIIGGAAIPPQDLIYRWSIDNTRAALAGAGKQEFRFRASDLAQSTHQIDVVVEDLDARIRKEGRALITTDATPRLTLYPSLALGGAEQRRAGSSAARPGLFDIIAEAFFFPLSSLSSLAYAWTIDGVQTPTPRDDPRLITIDATGQAGETLTAGLVVRAPNLFQASYSGFFNLFVAP